VVKDYERLLGEIILKGLIQNLSLGENVVKDYERLLGEIILKGLIQNLSLGENIVFNGTK
jgi:hypothetical protein